MTPARKKKKESYYDEALHVSVSFICNSASTLDGGRVWSVVLKKIWIELFDSIIIYGYVYSFWYKMMAL